jgi:hypothetical protein
MAKPDVLVDLIATKEPEASAQGETVMLTVPVIFADNPVVAGRVRITLSAQQAIHLAAQIQPAAQTARLSLGKGNSHGEAPPFRSPIFQ